MTQKTSTAERFTLAMREFVRAEMAFASSEGVTVKERDAATVRLEEAFDEAVDVRVQEALTYANRSDDY